MFGDRRASFRSYERIEEFSERARFAGRLTEHSRFSITEYITGPLKLRLRADLSIEPYRKNHYPVPAFVECRNSSKIVLNVEETVWANASAGLWDPRFILAHEIGHIIMHAHDNLAYSNDSSSALIKLPAEERVEPQANLFADLFLVPTRMLVGFSKAEDISEYFDVPLHCAERRLEHFIDATRRRLSRRYDGDACPECANFTLVRNGTCLKCDTCGSTTGCS